MSIDRKRMLTNAIEPQELEDANVDLNFALDDQKIERSQELEANFKRRKIEEWKQRMGFTAPAPVSGGTPSVVHTATTGVSGAGSSSAVIDLRAIKKQVEERKKLALETLQKSKNIASSISFENDTLHHIFPITSTSSPAMQKRVEPMLPGSTATRLELLKPTPLSKDHIYFDKSLGIPIRPKRRTALKFVTQGKFVQKATKLRTEAKLEALKQQVSESMKRSRVGAHLNFITEKTGKKDPPPLIEWWDLPLVLGQTTYEALLEHWENPEMDFCSLYTAPPDSEAPSGEAGQPDDQMAAETQTALITSLVLHPVPLTSALHQEVAPRPVILTKKERQKLRRQRRLEEQKEKQDKIRLGLLPPEQPKVRIANLMRVLQNEAIQDPTKVEAQVRQQMEQRKKRHEQTNRERQLTKEQKREKKVQQTSMDAARGLHACVFKCHPQCTTTLNKAKIYHNVAQLGLTGIGVMYQEHHMVVVEGGEKSLRHFKKLMLKRIQWGAAHDEHDEDGAAAAGLGNAGPSRWQSCESEMPDGLLLHKDLQQSPDGHLSIDPPSATQSHCWLLWEGDIQQRAFHSFKFKQCHLEKQVTDLFSASHVEHYWDLAKSWSPPSFL